MAASDLRCSDYELGGAAPAIMVFFRHETAVAHLGTIAGPVQTPIKLKEIALVLG